MIDSKIKDIIFKARDEARKQGITAAFFLHREDSNLIRLGNSAVALSTSEELTRFSVEVVNGRRVGAYSINADVNSLDIVMNALNRANENCLESPELDYQPIPSEVEEETADYTGYDPQMISLTAEDKTTVCSKIIKSMPDKYSFSGSWSSGETELFLATTINDNCAYRKLSDGVLKIVMKNNIAGWEIAADQTGKNRADFCADAVVNHINSLLPIYENNPGYQTAIGKQPVVFGPDAIAEMLTMALWGGFIGRYWEEKRAFTSSNSFGDMLFAPSVNIYDDPACPDTFGYPFDFAGRKRGKFDFVKDGTFAGLIYDNATAAKYGKKPTGHDIGTMDIVFATGDATPGLENALAQVGDAIYIPQLHYLHLPDPTRGQITGSSRFNAMRVVGGKFTAPLLSTRVTDTIPSIFSSITAISAKSVPINISSTYGRRSPEVISVPEYIICSTVRISDVADSF
jgi:predicted Zn-dependent protease